MSTANGKKTSSALREEVRQARYRQRLTEIELAQSRLDRIKRRSTNLQGEQLHESVNLPDLWISSYFDQMRRTQSDPDSFGFGSRYSRQDGGNWPIFADEQQHSNIREVARVLADWNGYARGLMTGIGAYVSGIAGFSVRVTEKKKNRRPVGAPQELIEVLQECLDEFRERNGWHGGELPGLEDELIWRRFVDGEFFLASYSDGPKTDVRIIEPELVIPPPNSNRKEWAYGIRVDPKDVAKHLSYWVQWGPGDGEEFTPDDILHVRGGVVRNVKRGLTALYGDVVDALHSASALRRNMSEGAAIQAAYSGIVQHDNTSKSDVESWRAGEADYTTTNPTNGRTEYYQKAKPGMVHVPKGQNFVQPPTATNAAAHVEILQATLRAGGTWCNAPEWLVSGLHDTSSFASSLTAESPWTRFVLKTQLTFGAAFKSQDWRVLENFVKGQPNGELVIPIGVIDEETGEPTGRTVERVFTWKEIERLVELEVKAPSPEMRNKVEDAQTNVQYVSNRLKSPQAVMQELGQDVEQTISDIEDWEERLGQAGLAVPMDKRLFAPKVAEALQADDAKVDWSNMPPAPPKTTDQKSAENQKPPDAAKPSGRSLESFFGGQRQVIDSIVLPVPDRRQDTEYSCGPACLEAVASYYGIEVPEGTLRKLSKADPSIGAETDDLAAAARALGLAAQVVNGMELSDLQNHLSQGHPVIVGVQAWQSAEDEDPETGVSDSGHYDVAIGFDRDKGSIWIQDPARADDAGRFEVAQDGFVRSWKLMGGSGQWVPGIGIIIGPGEKGRIPGEVLKHLSNDGELDLEGLRGKGLTEAIARKIASGWDWAVDRYGRAGAIAFLVGQVAAFPIPGSVGIVIGVAEALRWLLGPEAPSKDELETAGLGRSARSEEQVAEEAHRQERDREVDAAIRKEVSKLEELVEERVVSKLPPKTLPQEFSIESLDLSGIRDALLGAE